MEDCGRSLRQDSPDQLVRWRLNVDSPFTEVFDSDDLKCVKAFVDYWTISLITVEKAHKVELLQRKVCRARQGEHGQQSTSNPKLLALNICRSIAYFLQPFHVEAATFYLSVPIKATYHAFTPPSLEAKWLMSVTNGLANQTGGELLRNMLDKVCVGQR